MSNQQQYPTPPFEGGPTIPQRPQPSLPDPGQPEFGRRPIAVIPMTPTAWQSIPSPVRFAAWVWAISVILSVAGAVLFAVLMILGLAAGMGSL